MKRKVITLLLAFLMLSTTYAEKRVITIFTIGDSTMANKPLDGDNQERGWGQVLGEFFTDGILVDNHARNGRSSKSFINEGLWAKVLDKIKPGDYVLIQFGHNDEKPKEDRHTDPGSTFDATLERYVNETREKGGIPVLLNAIVRRNFVKPTTDNEIDDKRPASGTQKDVKEGNILFDTHGAYKDAPRNVAANLNVPFVDANQLTHDLVQKLGPVESKKIYLWVEPNKYAASPKGREDNTHLNIYGAHVIAATITNDLVKVVPALKKYEIKKEVKKYKQ